MKPARRSLRLRDYDYSQAGAYFVTVCAQNRECLFGDIVNREMALNDAGRMVERWWCELKNKFPQSETDEYRVMPNHFHGIIMIVGADLCVRPVQPCVRPNQPDVHGLQQKQGAHIGAPLPRIVQWFKTMTTNEYIRSVKQREWKPFATRLWQRNYYEHIVRDEGELNRIREYIANNPAQWELDRENPDAPLGTACRAPTRYEYLWEGNI